MDDENKGSYPSRRFWIDHLNFLCVFSVFRDPKRWVQSWALLQTLICGLFGLPPSNRVLPQSPMHTKSLKVLKRSELLKLDNYESFSLKNLGKRHIYVNGEKLDTGQIVTLKSCSSIDIRGIVLMFRINKEAVRQFLKNRNNKDDTKFKWCE